MIKPRSTRKAVGWIVALFILGLILLSIVSGLLVKWLWMQELGYLTIFWTLLSLKWVLFGLAFLAVFFFFWLNLRLVARNSQAIERVESDQENYSRSSIGSKAAVIVPSLVIGLIFGLVFYGRWDTYLRFRWGGMFGQTDPIFGADVGFYVFRLPFYELIQNSLTGLTFITLLVALFAYINLGTLQLANRTFQWKHRTVMRHLSILFLMFLGSWGWGFYLDRFELLFSTHGAVYGAGYTADNVTRITLWIMLFAAPALAGVILVCLLRRRFRLVAAAVGGYFILYFIILVVLPGLVQQLKVEPTELELERPYLSHNIEFTRKAYQLDRIEEKTYPSLADLTLEQISDNQETIDSIRLWDWRPILQTYRQTQEIRLYYEFYEVDVDRYHIGAEGYHQVMLSPRELAPQLPQKARTWVNQTLQYTHGYGLVMNFVSKQAESGLPEYIVKDIPPVVEYPLAIDQSAIYYGEKTPGYRIVNTKVKEFDYPKGSLNVYTRYEGKGGIPINSFWKKILLAWTQSDINILLTTSLLPESRIQIWRGVQERVARIAPFLQLDDDPYLVLSEGKLYWIQDAYTVSAYFPYSEPYTESLGTRFNYIRNSVKIVVDVYQGSVLFYVIDPDDPVLNVYRQAFPGVFQDLGALAEGLKMHLRYPEDLFSVQADLYRTYHMTDPQVFYNREDLWTFPQEKYAGTAIRMIPYYILVRLPGEEQLMYLLMTPFTPENRDNMIAWMAAKCDFPEYGELLFYQLPKERLTIGPIQAEAMIDQNTRISEQLSLWDQRGSRVIRGNLIVIPINNSFLYVEPVYLRAEGTDIPQLKRIIVISGNNVVMAPTLGEAITAVFGEARPEAEEAPMVAPDFEGLDKARQSFQDAEEAMEQGKWGDFGRAMESLKKTLER